MTISSIRRTVCVVLPLLLAFAPVACSRGDREHVSFLTVDTDPDWSPDGRLIAFASSRWGGGICLVRTDGTELRQLFRGNAS